MTAGRQRGVARCATLGRRVASVMLVAGALGAGACATGGGVGYRAAAADGASSAILIENNSWDPVTVYVSRSGQLWRLGDVPALGKIRFSAQRIGFVADGGTTYLVARPLAGRTYRSEPFMFPRGGVAVWTIENQTGLSHISVR